MLGIPDRPATPIPQETMKELNEPPARSPERTGWSFTATRETQGQDVSKFGAVNGSLLAPPDDAGEALDLPASGLAGVMNVGTPSRSPVSAPAGLRPNTT